jgi:hypothetical protein
VTNIDPHDIDTADPEILRRQAQRLKDDLARMGQHVSNLAGLVDHLADNDDEITGMIREYCAGDYAVMTTVQQFTDVNLRTEYEVRVTVPITITVVMEAVSEHDARENVCEYLSNEVTVSVSGADEWDYDLYDASTEYVTAC